MNELVTLHLDGSVTRRRLTAAELQRQREAFLAAYDPQTLVRRSLLEFLGKPTRESSGRQAKR